MTSTPLRPRTPRDTLRVGTRLHGRYRLQARIGRGGTADVWQAHDERLDRTVAVKALHEGELSDPAGRARLEAEARRAAALGHPAIVPVYDVIEAAGRLAIVLRLVQGTTLAERISADGPLDPMEAAAIGADLAGALAHAHHHGLIHRDVKPANVLVDEAGRVQLTDFGTAEVVGEAVVSEPGTVRGTLRYMAPEQLAGQPVDGRTDLYALGLVLVELLTGRPAFEAATPAQLVTIRASGPPPVPARTPAALTELVRELVAADPDARPPTADEVERRLRAIASNPAAAATSAAAAPSPEPPVVTPGLAAVSAGLAMLAPRDSAPPDAPPPDAAPRDADAARPSETIAMPVDPTVILPPRRPTPGQPNAGVASAVATAPAERPAPPAAPATQPAGRPRRAGRSVLLGVAGLVLGAVVLAGSIAALGHWPAFATGASPSPTPAAPAITQAPTSPPAPAPPPGKGHGHGKPGGKGEQG